MAYDQAIAAAERTIAALRAKLDAFNTAHNEIVRRLADAERENELLRADNQRITLMTMDSLMRVLRQGIEKRRRDLLRQKSGIEEEVRGIDRQIEIIDMDEFAAGWGDAVEAMRETATNGQSTREEKS